MFIKGLTYEDERIDVLWNIEVLDTRVLSIGKTEARKRRHKRKKPAGEKHSRNAAAK